MRVVAGVAEEVEGVGLQRSRARRQAGDDLNREHARVDRQHGPKDAAIAVIAPLRVRERGSDRGNNRMHSSAAI